MEGRRMGCPPQGLTWRGFLTLSMRMWLNCIAWVSRESCRSQRHHVIIRTQEPKNQPFKTKVIEEGFSDTLSKIDFFRPARCPQICNPQLVGKLCATPSAGLQHFFEKVSTPREISWRRAQVERSLLPQLRHKLCGSFTSRESRKT